MHNETMNREVMMVLEKKDLRVVIIKGNVASGKTTEAYKLVEQGYKRVNKDELRRMADNAEHSQENERIICRMRDTLILFYLAEGFSVVVDDTNLAPIHERVIRSVVGNKATVEVLDLTHMSLEECRRRNRHRLVGHIDDQVIVDMHYKYIEKREPVRALPYIAGLPEVVLCDIDGTLTLRDETVRNIYDTAKCEQDAPYTAVVRYIDATVNYLKLPVILVSGRKEEFRPETERWLLAQGITYTMLHMRTEQDGTCPDTEVKKRIWQQYLEGKVNVMAVWDDRKRIVEGVWRTIGLPCFQVADGNF